MTDIIERGPRTSPLRRPHGSDGFAIPDTTSCIDRRTTLPAAAQPDRFADATHIGSEDNGSQEIDRLYRAFAHVTPDNHPRTVRLLASGTRRTAQKVIEEAGEVALEAVKHNRNGIIRESADLLYHLVALLHLAGIDPDDVWTEMHRRVELLGIAEKLPKGPNKSRNRTVKRGLAAQSAATHRAANAE